MCFTKFADLQSKVHSPCFEKEKLWSPERLSQLSKGSDGFGFKCRRFWLPNLSMFRSGIYVLGGREVQDEATVLSLWRLLASKLSSLRLWSWAWTGPWPGYVGNITSGSGGAWQNTDGDKLIPFGWAFSCYFFAYEVLGLWMLSGLKSNPSRRPAGWVCFSEKQMIKTWQT